MSELTPEQRYCEVCGVPIRPGNATGICAGKKKPECRRERERRKYRMAYPASTRRCEVCGDPIRPDNKLGICANKSKPACQLARSRKRDWSREARKPSRSPAEKRYCEVCGAPIRSDNRTGICGNLKKLECRRERQRREALLAGTIGQGIKISAGDKFGRWTALEGYDPRNPRILVRCECGRKKRVLGSNLVTGRTNGCRSCATKFATRPPIPLYMAAGDVYNRFTVLKDVETSAGFALVRCSCPDRTVKEVRATAVKNGRTKSCGCLKRERIVIHGLSGHPLRGVYHGMKARCLNPKAPGFKDYGGRRIPITIFEPWLDLATFIKDIEQEIGPRPEGRASSGRPFYELDRIDPDGNYEPGNVRWADKHTQRVNQRKVGDLTDKIQDLTAQLQAATEQLRAPRKRKVPPPTEEPLF